MSGKQHSPAPVAGSLGPPAARYASLQVLALHLLLLAGITSALYCFGIIQYLPSGATLRNWDVIWYEQIKQSGYSYAPEGISNVAFFPLFPYLWRYSGLGLLGISLVNAVVFLGSATWLARQLALPARLQLLLLSTPVLLFMVVPYSEALFFAFGALLLVGLRQRRLGWWLVGLLGCGLTRSASTLFMPALGLMVLLWAGQPGQRRPALRWGALAVLVLALSVGVVALMQWQQTGEPWGFVKVKHAWGQFFRLPTLPLSDPSGIDMVWIDGLGVWVGVAAAVLCGWRLWQEIGRWRGRPSPPPLPLEVLFSLGYCASAGLFLLLFQGGSIWNAGRYLLTTPFVVVLLGYLATQPAWPWRRYAALAGATLLFWQVFGAYTLQFDNFTTPQALWYFGLLTVYLLLYLAWRQLRWQGEVTMLLYTVNMVLLLHLLDSLLKGYKVQ
ncbi:hypothetical protein [Hymenobacter bucti]|uniref:DUF2029 domain-containing protein n=1 Tax=Hymenobacter bucti TaxID=1844114 RepID=A0ABW4QUL8_9BACT